MGLSEQGDGISSATPSSTVKRGSPFASLRQLTYAWVGLWGVASDDLGNFYSRCVARGEQILNTQQPTARPEVIPHTPDIAASQPNPAVSKRRQPASIINAFAVVKPYHIDVNVAGGLPTKEEFDALLKRVEALAREVDTLVKQREEG